MKHKLFTLLLAMIASVGTLFAQSGTCTYTLYTETGELVIILDTETGELVISGTGAMPDYDYYTIPDYLWGSGRNSIYSVIIKDGVTSIISVH